MIEIPTVPQDTDASDDRLAPDPNIVKGKFGKHHLLWLQCLQDIADGKIKRLLGMMPPGSAKALALDTPIPTPVGWKFMGELRVGDQVFDEKGNFCSITWVSPVWRDRPVYSVTTDCGDTIIADQDHEWPVSLWAKPSQKRVNLIKLRTTKELASRRTLRHEYEFGPRCKKPMVVRAKFLQLPPTELPLDPYILGLWLGDGHTQSPQLTCGKQDVEWVVGELTRLGVAISQLPRKNNNFTVSLLDIRHVFRELGLIGGSPGGFVRPWGKKFIPENYLRGSFEQRLALLQGLVDTDGTVNESSGLVSFSNTNYNLVCGVAELVRSLGAKASISDPKTPFLNGKPCASVWYVRFFLKDAARMPRKAQRCCNGVRTPNTYLTILPCGRADTVCIEVDSPSHLFLCGRSMTPTHNSTYTSVVFPTWYLGRFPGKQIILASYGSELPKKLGRRARSIIKQPIYQRIFDTQLSDESAAADAWILSNGSEWMAAGILTGITGNRADGIIWDDLIKGRAEAESEQLRSKTWDEYLESLLSRKKPTSFEIGIMTRWHEDDPAGRILPEDYNGESGLIRCRDGCDWFVVCLPAEAEREDDIVGRKIGDRLWPEWFTEDHFKPYKLNQRTWSALYQQRPAPQTGAFFEVDWFKPYSIKPNRETLSIYGASDYAVSEGKGDWTVHVVVGIDPQHRMYLLDLWRARSKADKSIEAFCNLVEKWRPLGWAEETGQIKAALGPFLTKRLRERRLYVVRADFPTKGEGRKEIRAQSIAGRMAMDGLWVPTQEPWYPAFLKEMLSFPYGAHDDQPDALALIGQVLDKMIQGQPLVPLAASAKVISTDPSTCTVTLDDLFDSNEAYSLDEPKTLRIH